MIKREHKDRLFTFIFGREENKRWTLTLYNAVNGTHYTNPNDIELNTLSDTVYMGMRNDVSFLIFCILNLYAHQSSFNPNMPLRELMYLGRLYDKYIHQKKMNIYSSRRLELPVPKLVVFYNGRTDEPDEMYLELKDSFPEGMDPEVSDVQVRVRMLNINYGHNKVLIEACRPLMEYSWFVERIRKYRDAGMEIEVAVDTALEEMPDDFDIKGLLVENKAEVTNMCITEYNEEETMEMFKEEYLEEGREEGRDALIEKMLRNGLSPQQISGYTGVDVVSINRVRDRL